MRASRIFAQIGLVVLAIGTCFATDASAADVLVDGRRISLTDGTDPARRTTAVRIADRDIDLAAVDPTVTGASAAIGRTDGGAVVILDLPAAGWRRHGGRIDFRYRGRTGAVRSARLFDGRFLAIRARGPDAFPLTDVPQHEIGVVLTVGDTRFCAAFGGKIRRDDGKRFLARSAPAPATCPDFETTPATPTVAPTPAATATEEASASPTMTPEPSATTSEPTPSATAEPTTTTTATATAGPTGTTTATATAEPTATVTTTATATAEPTPTPTLTATATPTATPSPTATPCIGPECPGCTDGDGDGAGIGADCALHDCDDGDPLVHPGATETCNERDDDCDGSTDEGFDLASDPQNCGTCGNVCTLANTATAACASGTCAVATCAAGFSNADAESANGCECARNESAANDTSASALNLGFLPDSGSSASQAFRIMPWSAAEGFDVDWFRVEAADDFDGEFSAVFTLSGLPANDYRLTVHRGAPPGSSATYACGFLCLATCSYPASKTALSGGAATVAITMDEGSLCSDDGGVFYVSVQQVSGAPACTNLTLQVRNE